MLVPSQSIARLLKDPRATLREPASDAMIEDIAKRFDAPVPDAVALLWSASNGIAFDAFQADIYGADTIVRAIEGGAWSAVGQLGYLPLIEDRQSNFLALCLRAPLAPRVLFLPHDDGPSLRYRSLESCLEHFERGLSGSITADFFYNEPGGDYSSTSPRDDADRRDAEALLRSEESSDWIQAVTLLPEDEIDSWERLLETGLFVRREARARMGHLGSPEVRDLLASDRAAFESFVEFALAAARAAGLEVGARRYDVVRVAGHWIDLDGLFYRRNIPGALEKLTQWFTDMAHGRHSRNSGYLP